MFEGQAADVSVGAYSHLAAGFETQLVWRATDFHNSEMFLRVPAAASAGDGARPQGARLLHIDKPSTHC